MEQLFHGDWYYNQKVCGINQFGQFMFVSNENSAVGIAKMTSDTTIKITRAIAPTLGGWATNVEGTLSEDGQTLNWNNNTAWTRSA